jgi:hypothetical protein
MTDQIEAAGALATAGLAATALDAPSAGDAAHGQSCANCAAPLAGPFCAQCGQRAHLHRSVGDVFHEFLHGITHFDGKAWTTLPMLLFHPGKLTRSYIEGHRARYIAPVPLFLLVVFTMFFVLSFASLDDTLDVRTAANPQKTRAEMARTLADIDRDIAAARAAGNSAEVQNLEAGRRLIGTVGEKMAGNPDASITDRLSEEIATANAQGKVTVDSGLPWLDVRAKRALKDPKLMLYKLQTKAYKLSFLLVPLSLPWLWLAFFWKRGVGMYDHAIFTLYSISFMSLLFIVGSLLLSANVVSELVWVPLLLAPGVHMFVQLRGTYQLGRFSAAWRTFYLSIAAVVTLSFYLLILVVAGVVD